MKQKHSWLSYSVHMTYIVRDVWNVHSKLLNYSQASLPVCQTMHQALLCILDFWALHTCITRITSATVCAVRLSTIISASWKLTSFLNTKKHMKKASKCVNVSYGAIHVLSDKAGISWTPPLPVLWKLYLLPWCTKSGLMCVRKNTL